MALPLILVPGGAHSERQHASVLENATAVQEFRGWQRKRTCTGTFLGVGFPFYGTFFGAPGQWMPRKVPCLFTHLAVGCHGVFA